MQDENIYVTENGQLRDKKGRFVPGKTGNAKGRTRGSKNIWNAEMKKFMRKMIATSTNPENFQEELLKLPFKERWQILQIFLKYTLPTMAKTETKQTGDVKVKVSYKQAPTEQEDED